MVGGGVYLVNLFHLEIFLPAEDGLGGGGGVLGGLYFPGGMVILGL